MSLRISVILNNADRLEEFNQRTIEDFIGR